MIDFFRACIVHPPGNRRIEDKGMMAHRSITTVTMQDAYIIIPLFMPSTTAHPYRPEPVMMKTIGAVPSLPLNCSANNATMSLPDSTLAFVTDIVRNRGGPPAFGQFSGVAKVAPRVWSCRQLSIIRLGRCLVSERRVRPVFVVVCHPGSDPVSSLRAGLELS